MRYTAIAFEKLLDSSIKQKQDELHQWVQKKNDVLTKWNLIKTEEPISNIEKFTVIQGGDHINSIILRMIHEAQKNS